MFESMVRILKEEETERFKLEKFEIKENSFYTGIPKGEYIRLIDKTKSFDGCIMSDTPIEHIIRN